MWLELIGADYTVHCSSGECASGPAFPYCGWVLAVQPLAAGYITNVKGEIVFATTQTTNERVWLDPRTKAWADSALAVGWSASVTMCPRSGGQREEAASRGY